VGSANQPSTAGTRGFDTNGNLTAVRHEPVKQAGNQPLRTGRLRSMTHTRTTSSRRSGLARSLVIVRAISIVGSIGLLASCGESKKASSVRDEASPATTVAPAGQFADADVKTQEGAKAGEAVTGGGGATRETPVPDGRKRDINVGVEIEVKEVSDVEVRVRVLAESSDGFVNEEQMSLGDNPTATMVVKVPPVNLSSFLQGVNGFGKVVSRNQKSVDVTAQFTDLESRITTARASVARIRELVAKSGSVTELAQVESELSKRETELEQLLGQQRVLTSRTDYATVTVTLRPEAAATSVVPASKEKLPGQSTVLKRSTKGLIGALYVAWILLLALLPWAIVGALVLGPLWMVIRRRRRASAKAYAAARLAASDPLVTPAVQNLPEPVVQRTDSTV
jgi:Domain of unknown function (DUF4349)